MTTPLACRACGTPLTESFIDLGLSPLANSYVTADRMEMGEKFYPLHVKVCSHCHLVQLDEFESPAHIFAQGYAYFSSYSAGWLRHAEAYTEAMISRFGLNKDTAHIAEVASNDGYLLQYFVQRGFRVTGIEPAGNCAVVAEQKGVHSEVAFFGAETAADIAERRGKADLIAANNVLAHVPDIQDFVAGFTNMLDAEGVITFEFPHLLNLIKLNQFDTIYHEHFSYLALGPVSRVLEAAGLRVFDVDQLTTHGGSLRVFACHKSASHALDPRVADLRQTEIDAGLEDMATYKAYREKVIAIKEATASFLFKARQEGKTVCGYGAPAKGNTFLNYCGVGPEHIAFTVDRNPVKQDTLLPGTRIPVLAPEEIDRRKPDYVLILPWNLKREIAEQMSHVRDWGGKFVTAIPELEVF